LLALPRQRWLAQECLQHPSPLTLVSPGAFALPWPETSLPGSILLWVPGRSARKTRQQHIDCSCLAAWVLAVACIQQSAHAQRQLSPSQAMQLSGRTADMHSFIRCNVRGATDSAVQRTVATRAGPHRWPWDAPSTKPGLRTHQRQRFLP
jgi:hypothetical protein